MSEPARGTAPRIPELMEELHDLTSNLRNALERFRFDARLNDIAEKEMPDARQRLNHVTKLMNEAAHRTLDLVEQSGPPTLRIAQEAEELETLWRKFRAREIAPEDFRSLASRMDLFLRAARTDADRVRGNMAEVLLAQGYQDLSGQIIGGVVTLVAEVEKTLAELTRIARGETAPLLSLPDSKDGTRAVGPAIPGVDSRTEVVSDQQDVDNLLSDLGM